MTEINSRGTADCVHRGLRRLMGLPEAVNRVGSRHNLNV